MISIQRSWFLTNLGIVRPRCKHGSVLSHTRKFQQLPRRYFLCGCKTFLMPCPVSTRHCKHWVFFGHTTLAGSTENWERLMEFHMYFLVENRRQGYGHRFREESKFRIHVCGEKIMCSNFLSRSAFEVHVDGYCSWSVWSCLLWFDSHHYL